MWYKCLCLVTFLSIFNSVIAQEKPKDFYFKANSTFNFFNFYERIYDFKNNQITVLEIHQKVKNNKFSPSISIHTKKKGILEFEVNNLRILKGNQSFFDTLTKKEIKQIKSSYFLSGIRTSYNFNILPKKSNFLLTLGPSANLYFSRKRNFEYDGPLNSYQDIEEDGRYFLRQNALGIDLEIISKIGYYLSRKLYFEIACPIKLLNFNYSSYSIKTLKGIIESPTSFEYINYLSKRTDPYNYKKQFYFQISISYRVN